MWLFLGEEGAIIFVKHKIFNFTNFFQIFSNLTKKKFSKEIYKIFKLLIPKKAVKPKV